MWAVGVVQHGYGCGSAPCRDRPSGADTSAGSKMVGIDFDGDTTLEKVWATTTAKDWCIATYTSASHTEKEHRFRALFALGADLETTMQHRGAYWLIVNRLLAELELRELKDNCGQKPERLWYGHTNAVVKINEGAEVPDFLLKDIDYDEPEFIGETKADQIDVDRCRWLLREFLEPSSDDEYESYYVPVMAACAGVGTILFDDWVDWVLRGHHGHKEENIRPFKWRGLGKYAGHTKLYSLAKKQDPSWTSKLPSHLRFGAAGGAVGYTETDPLISFDEIISHNKGETMEFEPEPLPDSKQVVKRGRPKKSNEDAAKEREADVDKVRAILTNLRKNRLTNSIEYDDPSGKVVQLEGNDLDIMTTKLACEHGVFIPEPRIKSAIQYAAGKNSYCPITRYLDGCAAHAKPHPEWDRVGEAFLGNKHPLSTLAMQRMMIGAVARAYNPGASMSWLPILVGAQGVGKSMFARNLVPDALFAEITTPLDTLMKEQYRLHMAWLLELPEIDNYFNIRNIENFKNLVTSRVDEVRYPYASLPSKQPSRLVMIGKTNRNHVRVDSTVSRQFVPL